jgi:toxin ParE1/3/4
MERIKEAMLALREMPERQALVQELYLAAQGIRKLPVDNYLIYYSVNKSTNTINIVRVLYGKKGLESIL